MTLLLLIWQPDTGWCRGDFCAHWISKGRSARCFSMYWGNSKTREIIFYLTTVPQKLKGCKTTKNVNNTKVQCFRVSRVGNKRPPGMFFPTFWRHLVDFGRHCNVWATAGRWGQPIFSKGFAEFGRSWRRKITNLAKQANRNRKGIKRTPKVNQGATKVHQTIGTEKR